MEGDRRRRSAPNPGEVVRRLAAVARPAHGRFSAVSSTAEVGLLPRNGAPAGIREHARAAPTATTHAPSPEARRRFQALYREHFDFVYRNLRWLGIAEDAVDDALQDVYMIALRRIESFAVGSHPKAGLFAIATRVASNHRRGVRRRGTPLPLESEAHESLLPGPFDSSARSEAMHVLQTFLDTLDENKRAVFVMAELEQMSVPEIARALSANLNTVYTRLRVARQAFAEAVAALGRGTGEAP